MITLHKPRLHIAVHYAIGIVVGLTIGVVLTVSLGVYSDLNTGSIASSLTDSLEPRDSPDTTRSNNKDDDEFGSSSDARDSDFVDLLTEYLDGDADIFQVINGIQAFDDDLNLKVIEELDNTIGNRMLMEALLPILVLHKGDSIGYEAVFTQVKELDDHLQRAMFPLVIKGWAETDPVKALEAASVLVSNGFPSNYATEILRIWSEIDYEEYVENIHSLPITLQKIAQQVRFSTLANDYPDEASRHIGAFLGSIYQLGLAKTLARSWIMKDSAAALEWIKTAQNITPYVRQQAAIEALRTLALSNPREALEQALQLGKHPQIGSVTSDVFEVVAMSDIEYAKEMLPKLTHLSTQIAVARSMVKHEDWDGILELMNSVEHINRTDYSEYVFQYWAMNNPTTLLDRVVHLESDLASRAALELLMQNRVYYFLPPPRASQLEEMLTSEHQEAWSSTKHHPSSRGVTILEAGYGFSRTYSMDEVQSALYRDLHRKADILPFRIRE
ncbi:MAG: hypothetical protein F4Z01_03390 [Gammaproteobacteria bacterium]|nr:hypothetical protein [Gammaproteobacteria bacterium]MYF38152.1 hypothetical protein [Gammaproteobacteria bacterium]